MSEAYVSEFIVILHQGTWTYSAFRISWLDGSSLNILHISTIRVTYPVLTEWVVGFNPSPLSKTTVKTSEFIANTCNNSNMKDI
jgi:hypothetical protein